MSPPTGPDEPRQPRLTTKRLLEGAFALADQIGMDNFTIRKLATKLDTKPMTIYHHVSNKEAIIDGIVDLVFAEIDVSPAGTDWKVASARRARSTRAVLARHPWAAPLMESRTSPGASTLRHHNAVLGCLRQGGFSIEMTAHAYALVDAYTYGFALHEASVLATGNLKRKPGHDLGDEFEFGLAVIVDGLQKAARLSNLSKGQSVELLTLGHLPIAP